MQKLKKIKDEKFNINIKKWNWSNSFWKKINISLFCIFQNSDTKKKKMQYERANTCNLQRAYDVTKNGISFYRAARLFSVPELTLLWQNQRAR